MSVYDYTVQTADGGEQPLAEYAGKTLLIVNVASKCGFTPQYAGLERMQLDYADRGLQLLGFPCNQFGDQEPGTDAEIQQFCSATYDVTFPVFAKVDVNGADAAPLYRYLREEAPGDFGPQDGQMYEAVKKYNPERIGTDEVKWNFTKFLVGPDGAVRKRYESAATPEVIAAELDDIL